MAKIGRTAASHTAIAGMKAPRKSISANMALLRKDRASDEEIEAERFAGNDDGAKSLRFIAVPRRPCQRERPAAQSPRFPCALGEARPGRPQAGPRNVLKQAQGAGGNFGLEPRR